MHNSVKCLNELLTCNVVQNIFHTLVLNLHTPKKKELKKIYSNGGN